MNNKLLNSTIKSSHAVILDIPQGFGYDYLINNIDISLDSDIIKLLPRVHGAQKTKNINTEDILDLQEKTRGSSKNQQFYFILGADTMSEITQNKFLKLLEEPRDNLHFVLVTSRFDKMLLTIKSRAQYVKIEPISDYESQTILKKYKVDEVKAKQILFLANGLPGEIEKLATDKKYFDSSLKVMAWAKKWLSGDQFDKVIVINELKNDREQALRLLAQTIELLGKTLTPTNASKSVVKARKLSTAYRRIQKNGSVRLNLIESAIEYFSNC